MFLAVLPVLLLQVLLAIGLGMVLGVLNVFFRDVGQFFAIFMQFWFWFTPIVYPASILPPEHARLLAWNPMARDHPGLPDDPGRQARRPTGAACCRPPMLRRCCCACWACACSASAAGEMVDEL